MRRLLIATGILVLTSAPIALAAEKHQHHAGCSHGTSHREVIRQLIDIFHHAIDGEHDHDATWKDKLRALTQLNTWKQWLVGLNPVRIASNSYRAYHMQKNKAALAEHAMNLALVFPLSHGLEMAAAPVFGLAASAMDLPTSVVATGSSALSIIAIPGLDPLCFLIMAAYPLKPVHGSLTFARRGVQWVARTALVRFKSTPRMDFLEYLSQAQTEILWAESFRVRSFQVRRGGAAGDIHSQMVQILSEGDSLLLELEWRTEGKERYLHQVQLGAGLSNSPELRQKALSFAALFHWNTRLALQEAIRAEGKQRLSELANKFYVQSVDASTVTFVERAIHLPHTTVPKRWMKCSELLSSGVRTLPSPIQEP